MAFGLLWLKLMQNQDRLWTHWSAITAHGATPFLDEEVAARTWRALKKAFPDAGSAVLMPDHVHVVLPPGKNSVLNFQRFTGILSSVSQSSGAGWQPVLEPTLISGEKHLLRMLKYVPMNPCRDKMVDDPLLWRWSTYRDLFGATVDPWIGPAKAWASLRFGLARMHKYVSSDPDTDLNGTPLPRPLAELRRGYCAYSILEIAQAAVIALGCSSRELTFSPKVRRYFAWLARKVGFESSRQMAHLCAMSQRGVRWLLEQEVGPKEKELEVGLRILSEPRFRYGVTVELPQNGRIGWQAPTLTAHSAALRQPAAGGTFERA